MLQLTTKNTELFKSNICKQFIMIHAFPYGSSDNILSVRRILINVTTTLL